MNAELTTDDGARFTTNGIDFTDIPLDVEGYAMEEHLDTVAETDDLIVLRDTAGYELSEWANLFGVNLADLSGRMHELAREHYGRDEARGVGDPWSASDPLVLAK